MYTMKPCHQMLVTYVIAICINEINGNCGRGDRFGYGNLSLLAHEKCGYPQTNADD